MKTFVAVGAIKFYLSKERNFKIMGMQDAKSEERKNGYVSRLMYGIFCDECDKIIKKRGEKY